MTDLNVDSIFGTAEKMERNGAEFYRKAAETADENQRALLMALSQMEYNHEKTFAAMRSKFATGKFQPITRVSDSYGILYLEAVAGGKIFDSMLTPELTGQESIDRIFEIAISLEKDSIVFYQSMKSLVPHGEAADQLNKIIDEEIGHILELTRR